MSFKLQSGSGLITSTCIADESVGYFVRPTVILSKDPKSVTLVEEIFGPVLTVSNCLYGLRWLS